MELRKYNNGLNNNTFKAVVNFMQFNLIFTSDNRIQDKMPEHKRRMHRFTQLKRFHYPSRILDC